MDRCRRTSYMKLSKLEAHLRFVFASLIVSLFMFPIFWLGLTAIKPRSAIFNKDQVVWFEFTPTLENFRMVWFGPDAVSINESILSSTIIACGSTLVVLSVSIPAAFGLSRFRFRGYQWVFPSLLLQRFLPPIAVIIPLVFIFHNLGLRDTHAGVVLAHALINTPFAILILKSFFDDIPREIDDISLLDGASRFQSFWYIMLPTVRGGIAATAILCFVFSWTEFLLSLFLTSSIRTLPVGIALFDSGSQVNLIAATGISGIIPGLIFILLVQKQLVRGLTMGAMK